MTFIFGLYPFASNVSNNSLYASWCFVVIHHKETDTAIFGHEGKLSREFIVYDTWYFIGKCSETKHICNWFVIGDEVGTTLCSIHWSMTWYCGGSTKIVKMIGATCLIVAGVLLTISDALLRALHVSFCCCRTWVQVCCHQFWIEIGAPFEEPSTHSFQEGRYCWITQRLVGEFYGVGSSALGVWECRHLCQFWFIVKRSWGTAGHEPYRDRLVTGLILLHYVLITPLYRRVS
jgi:hypothetical protein